jgi:predicted RNA-binding protein (virulence factor B family)
MHKSINPTIEVGKINRLKIARDSDYGYYLEAFDGSEVLLPNSYIIESQMAIGSLVDVFVYTDSEDRVVAVTKEPYAKLDEIGYFSVVDTTSSGAFVNWGLPKDLFVPKSQQKEPLRVGKKYILRVCLDKQTNRLYATQKIGKFFNLNTKGLKLRAKLNAIVIAKTPLGFKVVANNQYEGMVFKNETFTELKIGQRVDVFIKNIRSDGKLDLSITPLGKEQKSKSAQEIIINELKKSNSKANFTYKSDAAKIKERFNISKKSFKSALTSLINSNKIELKDGYIVLKKQNSTSN